MESEFKKPRYIYKYCSLKTAGLIIKSNSIKFSDPAEFNDPFDCDINLLEFKQPESLNERIAYEINTLKEQFKNYPSVVKKLEKKEFIEEMYKGAQFEKIKSLRISCFSLIENNDLMWSHYADKHKGICLEFDSKLASHGFVDIPSKDISEGVVRYSTESKKINYLSTDRFESFYKIFLSKSESWSYEKEYRLITMGNKPELQKFKKNYLQGVYFGLKTKQEDINKFIALCSQLEYKNLSFFKAERGIHKIIFNKL